MAIVATLTVTLALLVGAPSSAQAAENFCDENSGSFMTFTIGTANGWGVTHCDFPGWDVAGCSTCTIAVFKATGGFFVSIGYRIRTANGWGDYRYDGETAGCWACHIGAIQIFGASPDWPFHQTGIKYRVAMVGGSWGDWKYWRSGLAPPTAGCLLPECAIKEIQINTFNYL
jgi:hypothetical protein